MNLSNPKFNTEIMKITRTMKEHGLKKITYVKNRKEIECIYHFLVRKFYAPSLKLLVRCYGLGVRFLLK